MKLPKIGSVVRLKQGDTSILWLVTGHPKTNVKGNFLYIKAVDELTFRPHLVDTSMVREETVSEDTHKKILAEWAKTHEGADMIKDFVNA